jgi:hypothetical protein
MLIKGLVWVYIIPPLQNPDEHVHFAYVQYMGEENKVPVQTSEPGYSHELNLFTMAVRMNDIVFKPESKYFIHQNFYHLLSDPKNNSPEMRVSTGSSLAAGYPPGYYFPASLVYKLGYDDTIVFRLYAVRIFSVLLSLVAVTLAYFIGKSIEPKSIFLAGALAITTGMHPVFSMVGAAVNNDIMMDTISIALLLWLLIITKAFTNKTLIIGGFVAGFGLLIKPQMFYVCGFILLFALIFFIKKYGLVKALKSAAFVAGPMVVLYLPWAIFSYSHYGSISGGVAMQPQGDPTQGLNWYFQNALFNDAGKERFFNVWTREYWAKFGWSDTRFNSDTIYSVLSWIMLVGIGGAVYGILRRKENFKIALFSLIFALGNLVFLYTVEITYFKEYHNFMLQGRYLLTSLVPINLVLLFGFRYIVPEKYKNYVYSTSALLMVVLNIMSMDLIYNRYY